MQDSQNGIYLAHWALDLLFHIFQRLTSFEVTLLWQSGDRVLQHKMEKSVSIWCHSERSIVWPKSLFRFTELRHLNLSAGNLQTSNPTAHLIQLTQLPRTMKTIVLTDVHLAPVIGDAGLAGLFPNLENFHLSGQLTEVEVTKLLPLPKGLQKLTLDMGSNFAASEGTTLLEQLPEGLQVLSISGRIDPPSEFSFQLPPTLETLELQLRVHSAASFSFLAQLPLKTLSLHIYGYDNPPKYQGRGAQYTMKLWSYLPKSIRTLVLLVAYCEVEPLHLGALPPGIQILCISSTLRLSDGRKVSETPVEEVWKAYPLIEDVTGFGGASTAVTAENISLLPQNYYQVSISSKFDASVSPIKLPSNMKDLLIPAQFMESDSLALPSHLKRLSIVTHMPADFTIRSLLPYSINFLQVSNGVFFDEMALSSHLLPRCLTMLNIPTISMSRWLDHQLTKSSNFEGKYGFMKDLFPSSLRTIDFIYDENLHEPVEDSSWLWNYEFVAEYLPVNLFKIIITHMTTRAPCIARICSWLSHIPRETKLGYLNCYTDPDHTSYQNQLFAIPDSLPPTLKSMQISALIDPKDFYRLPRSLRGLNISYLTRHPTKDEIKQLPKLLNRFQANLPRDPAIRLDQTLAQLRSRMPYADLTKVDERRGELH
jgi:hypothetical protein